MFACKTKYHRHRRKLLCQMMKAGLALAMATLLCTQALLIREPAHTELDIQSKQTKGEANIFYFGVEIENTRLSEIICRF